MQFQHLIFLLNTSTVATTQVNPGAFQKRDKPTLRKFAGRIYHTAVQRAWGKLFNCIASDGLNLLHQWGWGRQSKKRLLCPICQTSSHYFANMSNAFRIAWHSACPNCNSRARHRGLKFLYEETLNGDGIVDVLHFAPEPVLAAALQFPHIRYKTTDYLLDDVDYPGEDIQKLTFSDNLFDLVLCNHVIEHVEDDKKALQEMARILRPDGKAIITIPGEWDREETIYFDDLRHNGHYRDYGNEVVDLMRTAFSNVEVKNLQEYDKKDACISHGIKEYEPAFICSK